MPTSTRVVVEADGGSRGNPGPAGYGAVVFDADTGAVLAERSASLGTATNNVAEYSGLIAGLDAARELGATEVAVRMDSKLVVEQMKGTWQVKNEALRVLAREAVALRRGFERVSFTWIPRAQNAYADRLANEAMDGAGSTRSERHRKAAPSARPSGDDTPTVDPVADRARLAERVRDAALLHGEFLLRSGTMSNTYFDKFRVEADPRLLADCAAAMAALLPDDDAVLAGLETGGIPLVTAIGLQTGRSLRFVRKAAKTYGTQAQVEGGPLAGFRVVLIEDVVTSAGALLDALPVVRALGATVDTAVCLVDRQQGGRAALAAQGVGLRAVFTAADVEA